MTRPRRGLARRRLLATTLAVGGVPAALFALLVGAGTLPPLPGLAALAGTLLAALAVARRWLGGLAALSAALDRAVAGGPPRDDGTHPAPHLAPLPAVAEVADGVARLSRHLAERAAQIGRLRAADAAIVEDLPDPLVVLGADRAPLRTNRAARALFGDGDLAALLRHPILAEAVDRAAQGARGVAVDLVLPVPVARDLAAQVIPMDPPLSDGGRLVVVLSDRTRERAVERMRADFVANASHELRTPLASLIGFIETLRGPAEDDAEARTRFLAIMAEQADRMRRLMEDLLGLARIEMDEHRPPAGRADLAELAGGEAAAMAPILAGRGVRLEVALEPGAVAAPADAGQVAQVLRNLLENAVRHGRPGGTVRLTARPARPGEARPGAARPGTPPGVVLLVEDDGPGIAREHLPRLTERFYRVDKGRSRAAGGTGLGLAIVKHIVNRHRGHLTIESEPGAGSAFRVWLPGERIGNEGEAERPAGGA